METDRDFAIGTAGLVLAPDQAMALAQLVKRITWSDMRALSSSEAETCHMRDAIYRLQQALAEVPRQPRLVRADRRERDTLGPCRRHRAP